MDGHAADVMIANREEIRHTTFLDEAFDQRVENLVTLRTKAAVHDGIARLHNETNRKSGARLFGNCREHGIDHIGVTGLKTDTVGGPPCIAIRDERELRL